MLIVTAFLAFFLGATPTSYLVVKMKTGKDIRSLGSGNPGATNVFRAVGKREGLFVLLMDALKGVLAVSCVGSMMTEPPINEGTYRLILGLLAILGHVFSPYLKFRGGKGVATSLGVAGALYPLNTAISLAVWAAALWGIGYMSVASLLGAMSFGALALLFIADPVQKTLCFGTSLFILWTHRSNIKRLKRGEETKFIVKNRNI